MSVIRMSAAERARRTLEVLERDGWSRGGWNDKAGHRCLGNAWCEATPGGYDDHGEDFDRPLWEAIIAAYPGESWNGVGHWNDAPERTFAQVEAILGKIAAG